MIAFDFLRQVSHVAKVGLVLGMTLNSDPGF